MISPDGNVTSDTTPGTRRSLPLVLADSRAFAISAALIVAAVYAAGLTARWSPTPDSAAYLGLGRSLAAGDGYVFNGEINTQFAPGLPCVLAALRRAFGGGFFAPNIFVALCGLATVALISRTMRLVTGNRQMALSVALAAAFSYPFYLNSHRILSDVPFSLVLWMTLYAALRSLSGGGLWLVPAGLLAAVGVSLRAPGVLVILPAALGFVLQRSWPARTATAEPTSDTANAPSLGKRLAVGTLIALFAVATAGALYATARASTSAAPGYEKLVVPSLRAGLIHVLSHLAQAAAAFGPALAEVCISQRVWQPLGVVASALSAVGLWRLWRRGERFVPVVTVLYPFFLAVCLGSFGMRPRYLVPVAPLVIYAAIEGVLGCLESIAKVRGRLSDGNLRAWGIAGLTALAILCGTPKIARDVRRDGWIGQRGDSQVTRSSGYGGLFELARLVRREVPPESRVLSLVEEDAVLHYLSERVTVPLTTPGADARNDAITMLNFINAHDEFDYIVLEPAARHSPAAAELVMLLNANSLFRATRSGPYVLYSRLK